LPCAPKDVHSLLAGRQKGRWHQSAHLRENNWLRSYPQKSCEIHKERKRKKVAKKEKERNLLLLLALNITP
jgi:hypothetical protein